MSKDVLTGLNISKSGTDPSLKTDEEYPEWLWQLAKPERTLADLKRKENPSLDFEEVSRQVAGLDKNLNLCFPPCCFPLKIFPSSFLSIYSLSTFPFVILQLKRLQKLTNRDKIRTRNVNKAK